MDLLIPTNAALDELAGGTRYESMHRHEAYFRNEQDDHKQYNWDGYLARYGSESGIRPGWYVPLHQRRPSTTMPLARMIVSRLNSMLFGVQNRPDIVIAGDEQAESFVRALADESSLWQRMIEAREIGGASGTAVLSYGFTFDGKPRVEVHHGKHCRVLLWADFPEKIPAAVLKSYEYVRSVWDPETGKSVEKTFFFARYWDGAVDITWDAIPEKFARIESWKSFPPDRVVEHGTGECPVVWIQNTGRSELEDGESDYQGSLDDMDNVNRLKSASSKGTIANVDPTLVIHIDPKDNVGAGVKKGSENAIFSPNGASYLELRGDSIRAAESKLDALRQDILDAAQVVLPSPDNVSGSAQSAAALRILFAPMTSRCDVLREQYGDRGISRVLRGLLRQAKMEHVKVDLEPRMESQPAEDGDSVMVEVQHVPGTRELLTLVWPPYFPATWADKQVAAQTVKAAAGDKSVLSQETAMMNIAQLFGVDDVRAEKAKMDMEAEAALQNDARALAMLTPDEDEEDEDEDEAVPEGQKKDGVEDPSDRGRGR